eukprot:SAG31_NODE_1162_length_9594_cov_3.045498_7_plen_245_part_00
MFVAHSGRIRNVVKKEPWRPVIANEQPYAPAALDIVSMLMQVSRGYFLAELPVSEHIMKQLAEKFGFLMQIFARLVEQQCGEMPSLEERSRRKIRLESEPNSEAASAVSGRMGVLGNKMMMAKAMAQETIKHAIDVDGEENGESGGGEMEPSLEQDNEVEALCVRLASVHYILGSCDDLLRQIIDGALCQNYTGTPLDTAMDEVKDKLGGHCNRIAEHIGEIRLGKKFVHTISLEPCRRRQKLF